MKRVMDSRDAIFGGRLSLAAIRRMGVGAAKERGFRRGMQCWCLHCFETLDVGAVLDARGDECLTAGCEGMGWGVDLFRMDDPMRLQYYDKDGQLISGG